MSIIWIVEKAKSTGVSLAAALMGDYAVRVFASFDTFEKLLRINRNQRPDLLVIDASDIGCNEARIREFVGYHFRDKPVVIVGDGASGGGGLLFHMQRPVDSLRLSVFVDFLVRSHGERESRSVVRYRDVLLDFTKLQCLVMPNDEPMSLPLKEAQLLRLFLERPGVCMSREEIRVSIWDSIKITPRTIDSHISRLRKRLHDAEINIDSVYGGGYVLK